MPTTRRDPSTGSLSRSADHPVLKTGFPPVCQRTENSREGGFIAYATICRTWTPTAMRCLGRRGRACVLPGQVHDLRCWILKQCLRRRPDSCLPARKKPAIPGRGGEAPTRGDVIKIFPRNASARPALWAHGGQDVAAPGHAQHRCAPAAHGQWGAGHPGLLAAVDFIRCPARTCGL